MVVRLEMVSRLVAQVAHALGVSATVAERATDRVIHALSSGVHATGCITDRGLAMAALAFELNGARTSEAFTSASVVHRDEIAQAMYELTFVAPPPPENATSDAYARDVCAQLGLSEETAAIVLRCARVAAVRGVATGPMPVIVVAAAYWVAQVTSHGAMALKTVVDAAHVAGRAVVVDHIHGVLHKLGAHLATPTNDQEDQVDEYDE